MKNRGRTSILTNLVGMHPRNIYRKFDANPFSIYGEIKSAKQFIQRQKLI